MDLEEDGKKVKPLQVSHNYNINNKGPKPVIYIMVSDAEDLYRRIQGFSVDYENKTLMVDF